MLNQDKDGNSLLNKLNADREQVTEGEAPSNSLPDWYQCALRVRNSKWLKDNDRKPEHDSLIANPLHEFIYEYDDSDAYKSAWFMHRLEKLIDFVKAEQVPAVAVPDDNEELFDCSPGFSLYPIQVKAVKPPLQDQITAPAILNQVIEGLERGFIACPRCGDQENTKNLDCMDDLKNLAAMLSASPAPSHSQQSAEVVPLESVESLREYMDEWGDDTDMKVVKSELGEMILRAKGLYGLSSHESEQPAPDSEGDK